MHIFFVALLEFEQKSCQGASGSRMNKGTCSENDCKMVLQHPLSPEFVKLECQAGIDKKMNTGCRLILKDETTLEKNQNEDGIGSDPDATVKFKPFIPHVWMTVYIPNTAYDVPFILC